MLCLELELLLFSTFNCCHYQSKLLVLIFRVARPPNQTSDKCQSSVNMSFPEEDNIGDHLEDDVVQEALESGQDLREYSRYDDG